MLLFQSLLQLPISVCNDAFIPLSLLRNRSTRTHTHPLQSLLYPSCIQLASGQFIFLQICPHFTRPCLIIWRTGLSTILCLGTVVTTKCVTVITTNRFYVLITLKFTFMLFSSSCTIDWRVEKLKEVSSPARKIKISVSNTRQVSTIEFREGDNVALMLLECFHPIT